MKKFTIIDYIIIILVICAIAFAFIHITTDDSSKIQKTAFDASTINKIPDTYSNYYKDGLIVKTTVEGFNSTNNQPVTLNGTVVWEDDDGGGDVKLLIKSDGKTYLTGLYRYNPNADIYIDHISIESNGEKYNNLTEISIKPMKITSFNDLISKIDNSTNYEISTKVSVDSINANQIQEIKNKIMEHDKRLSIKTATTDMDGEMLIIKATPDNIKDADSVLGNVNGVTDEITIRVYDCTNGQLDNIKNNLEVTDIRTFEDV